MKLVAKLKEEIFWVMFGIIMLIVMALLGLKVGTNAAVCETYYPNISPWVCLLSDRFVAQPGLQ